MLENETTTVVGVGGAGLCPPLIIEATLLKESLKNASVSDAVRKKSPLPFPREEALRKIRKPVGLIHLPS